MEMCNSFTPRESLEESPWCLIDRRLVSPEPVWMLYRTENLLPLP
jgi:hypothetical protein